MKQLTLADKFRYIGGWLLVKTGRLTYDAFTQSELTNLLKSFLPLQLDIDVPVGRGKFCCLEGEIIMPSQYGQIQLNLFTDFQVELMGNPIYRAHIIAILEGKPSYKIKAARLDIDDIRLHSLTLVHDEYSLIKDTSTLLQQLTPISLVNTLTAPFKHVVNTVTAGLSDSAVDYLQSYTNSNKQKLLDQHTPAIESALYQALDNLETSFTMRPSEWRESLFARFGKRVSVDDHLLKFWFS